jgi:LysM repeat protein
MYRRQLVFVIAVNALISLAIALGVAWAIEARRPDPEELAALYTPAAQVTAIPVISDAPVSQPTPASEGDAPAPPTATTAPATEPGEQEIYVVQVGDSLGAIAGRFGVTIADIVEANGLENQDFIFSGQRLVIPRPGGSSPATGVTTTTASTTASPLSGVRFGALESPGSLLTEALSVVNDSNVALNLQGWRLEREGGPVYTFGSVSVFPGGSVWVHSNQGNDTSVAVYWGQPEAIWQSGAVARLVDPQGNVVATYAVP